jgi:uncharacterized protein (DUF58 family)
VLLAAPLAFGGILSMAARPRGTPQVRLLVPPRALLEGDRIEPIAYVESAEQLDLVAVELVRPTWLVPDGEPAARAIRLGAGQAAGVRFVLRTERWGRRTLGPAVVRACGSYGMLRCGPFASGLSLVTTWPLREEFVAVDAMPQAAGMVGPHRSRRPGEGVDVAGVRPFAPGDRLRRVNWRVSQRTDRLHVTATYSDRDSEVLICVDTRYDMGRPPASCLDVGVRAAAAIAEHYLRHGDRVGLVDLGRTDRRVPAGYGRGHLVRILDVLLDVRPLGRDDTTERFVSRLGAADLRRAVPPGALIVVLTPLAGEAAFTVLASLARSGRSVVAVDTLPPQARPDPRGNWTELAHRLWLLERDGGIGRLGEHGVPVVPWRGSRSLDYVLRDVSRAARAPRLVR